MNKSESKLKLYTDRVKKFDTSLKALIRQKDVSHECNEVLRGYWAELVYHSDEYKPDRVNAVIAPKRLAELAVIGSEVIVLPAPGSNRPLVISVADAPYREGDNLVIPTVKSLDITEASSVVVPVFNPRYGEPFSDTVSFRYPITLR